MTLMILMRYLAHDILVAKGLVKSANQTDQTPYVYVLVPRDFEELPQKLQNGLASSANKIGVDIMVCPETVIGLEADSARRLDSSRIMRE